MASVLGMYVGRTATHVPWGNDWITGLIWDVTIREGRKPGTLLELMLVMTSAEEKRCRRSKAQF
jgi:hypothetical protein